MLTPEDKTAIDGLFDRLADVERKAPPRDPEAERLIDHKLGQQPGAPYYLAQTVLVQERALELAQERIEELERQVTQRRSGGGFLGGLFGDSGGYDDRRVAARQSYDERGPSQRQAGYGYGGGGFLAGAAQTALGVTGGVLLGSAIASMFSAGAANAAEAPVDDQPANDGGDAGHDGDAGGGGFGDDGGDLGGGDFDMGGDF